MVIKEFGCAGMSILEELFYGNINPNEKSFDPDSRYASLIKTISDNESRLTNFLAAQEDSKEEQHWFSQLMNAQSEVLLFSERNRFVEGFQLGARFILDTFVTPGESVIRDIT